MAYSVKSSSLHATRAAQRRCGCSGPGRSGRFGCSLMLQDGDLVQYTYVGQVPLAKNYGKERLFRLSRVDDVNGPLDG